MQTKPITTITIVKAVIRVFFMGYMYFMIMYLSIIQFSIHVAHRNPWGINEDVGASVLMMYMVFMAIIAFITMAIYDQE